MSEALEVQDTHGPVLIFPEHISAIFPRFSNNRHGLRPWRRERSVPS